MSDRNSRVEIVATSNVDELLTEIAARRHPDPTPIRPGAAAVNAAEKAGETDEYSNRMRYRHDGEW